MSHYTVSYTTRSFRGGKRFDVPQTLHGLPKITAERYATCDNFKMTAEFPEPTSRAKARSPSSHPVNGDLQVRGRSTRPASPGRAKKSVQEAATSGDLSAAINGETE